MAKWKKQGFFKKGSARPSVPPLPRHNAPYPTLGLLLVSEIPRDHVVMAMENRGSGKKSPVCAGTA
jgi:hypothetical protein